MSKSQSSVSAPVLDDLLGEAAARAGGIQPLLLAFFGFLSRRTDFYIETEIGKPSPLGFPPGAAQRMVLEALNSYAYRDVKETPQYQEFVTKGGAASTPPTSNKSALPSSPSKKTTITSPSSSPSKLIASTTSPASLRSYDVSSTSSKIDTPSKQKDENRVSSVSEASTALQIPIGNGGVGPGYSWTQTLNELTIYIDLEPGVKRSEVTCSILTKRLHVELRPGGGSGLTKPLVLISGELDDVVKPSESMWTMSAGIGSGENGGAVPQLTISLDKARRSWWRCVVIGDPQIDTTKVDSSQNIDEYDEVTQANIRKLMFEQKQRRLLGQLDAPPDLPDSLRPTGSGRGGGSADTPPLHASLAAMGLTSTDSPESPRQQSSMVNDA